jgi:acetyltransferase-like isoleucine patch superfamily enzyme
VRFGLGRPGERLGEWIRCWRYRRQLATRSICLHNNAYVYAEAAIEIGDHSFVDAQATLAACELMPWAKLNGVPNGKIVLGRRCSIGRGAILATYGGVIELGDDVSINPYSILYGHGGLKIGNATRIAAHTVIVPANHIFNDLSMLIKDQGLNSKGILIGRDVWIGAGVRILDDVTIGDGSVIAAGAVVNRSVYAGEIVAGVPAKVVGQRGITSAVERKR